MPTQDFTAVDQNDWNVEPARLIRGRIPKYHQHSAHQQTGKIHQVHAKVINRDSGLALDEFGSGQPTEIYYDEQRLGHERPYDGLHRGGELNVSHLVYKPFFGNSLLTHTHTDL